MTQTDADSMPSTSATPRSLRALLTAVIDYAGLFPPATLELPAVINNYSNYLQSPDAWMLGRLIVPAAKLDELEKRAAGVLPKNADDEPWRISALVKSAADEDVLPAMDIITSFNERHEEPTRGLAVIETIELKAESPEQIDHALDNIPDDLFPFFECPVDADPRGLIAVMAGSDAGAKIRTGGLTAEMYPQPAHVARFLTACLAANVPFKATAGMHHPLRHRNDDVEADEFGFLNFFMAACLQASGAIHDDETLTALLTEPSIRAFAFDDDAAAWRDLRISAEQIEDWRSEIVVSFGSCSFDEPRNDLRALNLLA